VSIALNLEVEESIVVESLKNILSIIPGAKINLENDGNIEGVFPETNVSFYIETLLENNNILAEEANASWGVGVRIHFYVDYSVPKFLSEIKDFIIELAKNTDSNFILSFQYESIYAENNNNVLSLDKNLLLSC